MQGPSSRRKLYGRVGKYYGRAPRGYSRARAQRRGRAAAIRARRFVPGYNRTGGFYGRYAGAGELKFHDVDLDDAAIATAGTITASINLILQGVTEVQRVGRKCTITNVNWRYNISLAEADAVADPRNGDTVRVIMFLDKQANGATAAVTDILESADWQSFNNLSNSARFRTLYDKTHNLNYLTLASDGAGVVSSASVARESTFFKRCSVPLEFSATTGAIGEIRSNNIGVLLISRTGASTFGSKIRLRFSDGG